MADISIYVFIFKDWSRWLGNEIRLAIGHLLLMDIALLVNSQVVGTSFFILALNTDCQEAL
jgi:hypothetical protein